jgi:NADH-quinone oxidoreductase subunit G
MGADIRTLVPFDPNANAGTRADMGQSRGVQSGEADRHAVWLTARNLEPKLSPFDPTALLDEIQRLVPSYDVSRMDLLAGNDQPLHANAQNQALVQIVNLNTRPDGVQPTHDSLFTSGTLGRYSQKLMEEQTSRARTTVAAD